MVLHLYLYPKLKPMTTTITEFPMKCFRLQIGYKSIYDIFIPDIYDMSSIVMITDFNGDMIPYDEWDSIGNLLQEYLTENVY